MNRPQAPVASISKEELSKILDSMIKINEVQYEHVGIAGGMGKNYENYMALKNADTSILLGLVEDTNAVVACYAGWALIDQSYAGLATIFSKFLTNDKVVETFIGCTKGQDMVSNEFYHRYWNNLDPSQRPGDKDLFAMDSIILYNNAYWLLTLRALENRVYPASFDKRIEYLAFEQVNSDALSYLIRVKRDQYKDKIKAALLEYLISTDFVNVGVTPYFETIKELLKFNDVQIKKTIVRKLKKDSHWKHKKEEFLSLLQEYNIHQKDII